MSRNCYNNESLMHVVLAVFAIGIAPETRAKVRRWWKILNPNKSNGFSHPYHLSESTFIFFFLGGGGVE